MERGWRHAPRARRPLENEKAGVHDGHRLPWFRAQTDSPTVLRILLTLPPRKMRAMIATIAMRARISAYSARPWPSSSRRNDEIRAVRNDIRRDTSFPHELPGRTEGRATLRTPVSGVNTPNPPIRPGGVEWRQGPESKRPPAG